MVPRKADQFAEPYHMRREREPWDVDSGLLEKRKHPYGLLGCFEGADETMKPWWWLGCVVEVVLGLRSCGVAYWSHNSDLGVLGNI